MMVFAAEEDLDNCMKMAVMCVQKKSEEHAEE